MRALVICGCLLSFAAGAFGANPAPVKAAKPEAPSARAWRVLRDGVNAKKFADRVVALKALTELRGNVKGVRLVATALKDNDPDVRAQAAATLGQMKSRAAIPALRIALGDPAPQVSFAAAKSLWQLGDTTGRRVLLDVLQGDKGTKDGFVAGHIRDARRQLKDKKALVAMGAEKSAGEFLPGPLSMGVGLVKAEVAGSPDLARADCASLLSDHPDKETLLAFKAALVDRDWAVRAAAANALGRMARPDTVTWLVFALDDGKPAVRDAAAVAILRMSARRPTTSAYAKLR